MANMKTTQKGAPDAHEARSFTDSVHAKVDVNWLWLLADVVSVVSYLIDIGTDIAVAVLLYKHGHAVWSYLTIGFVAVASIVMMLFSLRWYLLDSKHSDALPVPPWKWAVRIVFLVFQLGPILRYIDALYYGIKVLYKPSPAHQRYYYHLLIYEDVDSTMLRLFEAFIESAPQLVLQLYIMATLGLDLQPGQPDDVLTETVQAVSCIFSLLSLSWALASYHRSLRISLHNKENMSLLGAALQFLWRFCTIACRVVALALFATHFNWQVFVVCGVHWALMSLWIMLQKTHFCGEANGCDEKFFDLVVGIMYIFCFFNVSEGKTRSRYLLYYFVVYVENAMMILVWYFTVKEWKWYKVPSLVLVLGVFWIGVIWMLIYYWWFHPNKENIDGVLCIKRRYAGEMGVTPSPSRKTSHSTPVQTSSRPSQVSATSPPSVAQQYGIDETDEINLEMKEMANNPC